MAGTMEGGRPPRKQPGITYSKQRDELPLGTLSEAEIETIRARARQQVADEIKDKATKQLLEQFVDEERQMSVPGEEMLEIYLNLAPHSQYIMLDGRQFMHEHAYRVKRSVFAVLVEQMTRGWAHDDQTQVQDSKGRRRWRPPLGIGMDNFNGRVGPWGANRNLTVSAGEALRSSSSAIMGVRGAVEGLS
jgi:hypothetical protein